MSKIVRNNLNFTEILNNDPDIGPLRNYGCIEIHSLSATYHLISTKNLGQDYIYHIQFYHILT